MRGALLTLYRGPMYSGKSKRLITHYGEGTVAFRPDIDSRYGEAARIYSYDRVSAPAVLVDIARPQMILDALQDKTAKTVLIDEVSFFPTDPFVEIIDTLTEKGISVVLGGLDYDANRNPWGPMLVLAKTKQVHDVVLTATCEWDAAECRKPAEWSFRKEPRETILVVGSKDLYGAACTDHHSALHHPANL